MKSLENGKHPNLRFAYSRLLLLDYCFSLGMWSVTHFRKGGGIRRKGAGAGRTARTRAWGARTAAGNTEGRRAGSTRPSLGFDSSGINKSAHKNGRYLTNVWRSNREKPVQHIKESTGKVDLVLRSVPVDMDDLDSSYAFIRGLCSSSYHRIYLE